MIRIGIALWVFFASCIHAAWPLQYTQDLSVGGFGSVLGYFHTPAGLSGDSRSLFIVDSGNGRIIKTDFNFLHFDSFQPLPTHWRPLDRPWGIAVDGLSIWVSDTQNHRLIVYSYQGTPQRHIGELGIFEGNFDTPKGLTTQLGTIWVADSRNNRIQKYRDNLFTAFGDSGGPSETLDTPYDSLWLPTEEIVVSDSRKKRLSVFNMLGQWTGTITPNFPKNTPEFGHIAGLGLDQDGHIFVADPDNERVVVLTRTGQVMAILAVSSPEDIYAWGNQVFVSDSKTHRILRFTRQ